MYICANYMYMYLKMCPFVFHRANWVKVYGTKYQTPCALVVGKTDDDPLFERVHKIVFLAKRCSLNLRKWMQSFVHTTMPMPSPSHHHFLVKQKDLITYHPYGLYRCPHISTVSSLQYSVLRSNAYMYVQ